MLPLLWLLWLLRLLRMLQLLRLLGLLQLLRLLRLLWLLRLLHGRRGRLPLRRDALRANPRVRTAIGRILTAATIAVVRRRVARLWSLLERHLRLLRLRRRRLRRRLRRLRPSLVKRLLLHLVRRLLKNLLWLRLVIRFLKTWLHVRCLQLRLRLLRRGRHRQKWLLRRRHRSRRLALLRMLRGTLERSLRRRCCRCLGRCQRLWRRGRGLMRLRRGHLLHKWLTVATNHHSRRPSVRRLARRRPRRRLGWRRRILGAVLGRVTGRRWRLPVTRRRLRRRLSIAHPSRRRRRPVWHRRMGRLRAESGRQRGATAPGACRWRSGADRRGP